MPELTLLEKIESAADEEKILAPPGRRCLLIGEYFFEARSGLLNGFDGKPAHPEVGQDILCAIDTDKPVVADGIAIGGDKFTGIGNRQMVLRIPTGIAEKEQPGRGRLRPVVICMRDKRFNGLRTRQTVCELVIDEFHFHYHGTPVIAAGTIGGQLSGLAREAGMGDDEVIRTLTAAAQISRLVSGHAQRPAQRGALKNGQSGSDHGRQRHAYRVAAAAFGKIHDRFNNSWTTLARLPGFQRHTRCRTLFSDQRPGIAHTDAARLGTSQALQREPGGFRQADTAFVANGRRNHSTLGQPRNPGRQTVRLRR